MYFNSEVRKLLAQMEAANLPALNQLPLEEARRAYQEVGEQLGCVSVPVERIDDFNADGPAGRLPLRMYRPYGLSENPAPALIYFHGGGWTLGSIQTHDKVCRRIADQAKCVVISVEYRLAPTFPAAGSIARRHRSGFLDLRQSARTQYQCESIGCRW